MRYTTLVNTKEAVLEYLKELDNDELVSIHNTYCDEENQMDDYIYNNDESFFEEHFNGKVIKALQAVCYGRYQYNDDYVQYNGYANLESFDSPEYHVDMLCIVNSILDNPSAYDIELEDEEVEEDENDTENE